MGSSPAPRGGSGLAPGARAPGLTGQDKDMWLIVLEALGALVLLILIVWWTMFSGRRKGERTDDTQAPPR